MRLIEPLAMGEAMEKAINAFEMGSAGVGAAGAGYMLGIQHLGAVVAIYGATVLAAYLLNAALHRSILRFARAEGQG
jgi:hypothetical protein